MDSLALASRNNAAWCDLVCRSHGLRTEWTDEAWTCLDPPPALYPQMVTLRPGVTQWSLHRRPVVVKDAFAERDELPGYDCLLSGRWWMHEGTLAVSELFVAIQTSGELEMWREQWDGPSDTFPDSLLDEPDVCFVAGVDGGWGGILNHFDGSVGITNVYGDLNRAYRSLLGAIGARYSVTRVFLWERDDISAPLEEEGFVSLGPLRVWVRQDSA